MQITNPTSSSSTLASSSTNTYESSASSKDKNFVTTTTNEATPAAQVHISETAQKMAEEESLPRYLKPTTGYADPNASFGNVFDYLKPSDQTTLKEAYDYALANGTSLEKVEEAAFFLGVQRNSGTGSFFHVSDEGLAFINAKPEHRADELNKLIQNDPNNKFYKTLQRAEQGNFFGADNPILNQSLFTDAVDNHLGPFRSNTAVADRSLAMPNAPTDPESLLLNHLSGSDKSSLSKAYQNAKENNLDPEEVRKAALLLAVERMNENMSKSFSDNSTAANAVKASSNMYQSIVDTPDKLIDLAQQVLGDDAAESFSNMVGQSRTEELFGRNSALRQALFLQPAYNLLNMMQAPS